jgi:aspartate/methionine/tyrosine aminotransferase
MVAPERGIRDIEKLAQNLFICPSAPAQYAALAAFSPDSLAIFEERRLEWQRRRNFLLPALRSLGFSLPVKPQGAFDLHAGCKQFGLDGSALARHLLDEAGVAITPDLDFHVDNAEAYMRFAYTLHG